MANEYKPYVDPKETLKELTLPPLILGAIMAVVLGAANVYLGLKAGMTVAATFPAAVLSMAVLKLFKGNILEENIARTTGAVGEALAAGAIFTVPAFILVGAWGDIELFSKEWLLATALLLVGGILGVLLMILLRRTFMEDASLPFPESLACTEIVKAGQGGQSGAGAVFAAMGVAGLVEFFKNGAGVPVIGGHYKGAFKLGEESNGAFPFFTPEPSPAFLAVGYIIGPKYGAIAAAGGIFGWLFLTPVILFMMAQSDTAFATAINGLIADGNTDALFGGEGAFPGLKAIYASNVKMIAIGAMIVGAFFTLFKMRSNLKAGIGRSLKAISGGGGGAAGVEVLRTDKDINVKFVFLAIVLMLLAMLGLYTILCSSFTVSLVVTVVMAIMSFLFAAVAGFLVSIIGSSSNPISGLTLSTLLIAAGLLVLLGMGGQYEADGKTMSATMSAGVLAVLGVATVVCCVAGVAGDMAQDWKVGYLLGGTPWRMEVGGFIGVIAAALFLVSVITLLHQAEMKSDFEKGLKGAQFDQGKIALISGIVGEEAGKPAGLSESTRAALKEKGFSEAEIATIGERAAKARGIGGDGLSAPQAGLMATTSQGIISGQLPWELILIGMMFAFGLIFVGVPSPMLVAVGMYLPFQTTTAIFTGGVIAWIGAKIAKKLGAKDEKEIEAVNNQGLLVASGFVAGEALMGIILAVLVTANIKIVSDPPAWFGMKWLGGVLIAALAFYLIKGSMKGLKTSK
ncbi:MAG: oligopeptide transporter, OPT family [Proteobacteria bacterium]|jgi:putative OPT family oligopeptide transporter|nr:oligopeptide transporter, OPT family [Pseudomonadota bacterium]